jgi:cruciform cutting endonuclease 1
MALTIPTTLKLSQLKQIAYKCGTSVTGTKPIIIQRLHDEITNSRPSGTKEATRILSIDMGIRNLAYCILEKPHAKKGEEKRVPIIQAWHRLAVSSAPKILPLDEKAKKQKKEVEKESFTPATLSQTAYTLLRKRLLVLNPTHVLIERQRFRSMGSKHILEWTIRVNMFESILYGVLCTLREEGVWKGSVEAIAPGKVGPFWVGEDVDVDAQGKLRKSKSAKIQNKGAKIDLVKRWLEGGVTLELGNSEVEGMARAYKEKWERSVGRGKVVMSGNGERMGKLDDLADSLLQGMAWIQWEENKNLARTRGVEVLLEP